MCCAQGVVLWIECSRARLLYVDEKSGESKWGFKVQLNFLCLDINGFRPLTSLLACSLDWLIWEKCSMCTLLLKGKLTYFQPYLYPSGLGIWCKKVCSFFHFFLCIWGSSSCTCKIYWTTECYFSFGTCSCAVPLTNFLVLFSCIAN